MMTTILKHIKSERENGTAATPKRSAFLGSTPEVTRDDDLISVFQYGLVVNLFYLLMLLWKIPVNAG